MEYHIVTRKALPIPGAHVLELIHDAIASIGIAHLAFGACLGSDLDLLPRTGGVVIHTHHAWQSYPILDGTRGSKPRFDCNEGCDVLEERAIFQERDSTSQQQFVIDPQ